MELENKILDEEQVCAGCQKPLNGDYFLSPCGINYCAEECYLFYNED